VSGARASKPLNPLSGSNGSFVRPPTPALFPPLTLPRSCPHLRLHGYLCQPAVCGRQPRGLEQPTRAYGERPGPPLLRVPAVPARGPQVRDGPDADPRRVLPRTRVGREPRPGGHDGVPDRLPQARPDAGGPIRPPARRTGEHVRRASPRPIRSAGGRVPGRVRRAGGRVHVRHTRDAASAELGVPGRGRTGLGRGRPRPGGRRSPARAGGIWRLRADVRGKRHHPGCFRRYADTLNGLARSRRARSVIHFFFLFSSSLDVLYPLVYYGGNFMSLFQDLSVHRPSCPNRIEHGGVERVDVAYLSCEFEGGDAT
jgi:hypothetical protein